MQKGWPLNRLTFDHLGARRAVRRARRGQTPEHFHRLHDTPERPRYCIFVSQLFKPVTELVEETKPMLQILDVRLQPRRAVVSAGRDLYVSQRQQPLDAVLRVLFAGRRAAEDQLIGYGA